MRDKLSFFALILLCILLFPITGAAKPYVKVVPNPASGRVYEGQTFHIWIKFSEVNGNLNIANLTIPGCKKLYWDTSPGQGSETYSDGRTTTVDNYKFFVITCRAETPGKYNFGPIKIGGIESNKISYQILAQDNSNQRRNGGNSNNSQSNTGGYGAGIPRTPSKTPVFVGKGNEEMFLKASVNKTSAYEQEAIEYTVKLYSSYDVIKFLGATAAPKFDGFVVEESDDISSSYVFEDLNGKTYITAVIAKYIIFPQKSGHLKISGNTYTVSTDAKQYYKDFDDETLTVKYPVQLNITPNDITLDIKPLPVPIPDNFIGGVGKFSLSASMPSKNLKTNAPASLIYTFEGTGNIKYLRMPELSPLLPSSVEVYSPDVKTEAKVGSTNVSGSSVFNYSIVPRVPGNLVIPSLTFTYFDPEEGSYKNLTSQSFTANVTEGQTSSKSQQSMKFNSDLMPVGKVMVKVEEPYISSLSYWLWYIIPTVIFIFCLVAYRKYLKDHEDLTLLRSKQANKIALKKLSKAYQCFKNHKDEEFYDEMLAALWGYLGDKLKMPTSELNRNNVGEEMSKHGVQTQTFQPIINLIDECEYAKYTPVARDANMRQIYYDALTTLSNIENEYSENKADSNKNKDDDDDE